MRWERKLPLLDRLRATWIETIHHEQTSGFLGSDAFVENREVSANQDGKEAARFIEALLRYVAHDNGCAANDLDYLDKSPCTCGLREFYNPKGVYHLEGR